VILLGAARFRPCTSPPALAGAACLSPPGALKLV
jgi:hypothetical protein